MDLGEKDGDSLDYELEESMEPDACFPDGGYPVQTPRRLVSAANSSPACHVLLSRLCAEVPVLPG